MNDFVVVDGLVKKYGDLVAVDNLSFTVKQGEIFGLLGPNGAGKSTTMNVITTLNDFNKGNVTVNGFDVIKKSKDVKGITGLVPQDIALYSQLTAMENVKFFASLYGLRGQELNHKAQEALEFVGLGDKAKLKVAKMSGGMKRRLNIACGIAHNPKLIVMDEPTVGVDAQSREHILNSIRILKERGATVIYTSHYMQEVEEICDRIAIVDKGRLVACGTKDDLVALVTDSKGYSIDVDAINVSESDIKKALLDLSGVKSVEIEDTKIKVSVSSDSNCLAPMVTELSGLGLVINNIASDEVTLEMVFLTLTGHELR